jgi:hypothetical protein
MVQVGAGVEPTQRRAHLGPWASISITTCERILRRFAFNTGQGWCLIIEERLIVPSRTTRTLRDNSLSVRHFRSISKESKGTQKDPFFGIQYQMAVSNGALKPLRILFMVEPLIAESPP